MRDLSPNHYERAFENWLIDHHIPYVHSEEHHRPGPSGGSVKNFDFLLSLEAGRRIIVEVKGRTFAGTTLAGLSGLECWVTRDDVASLRMWQKALGATMRRFSCLPTGSSSRTWTSMDRRRCGSARTGMCSSASGWRTMAVT